MAIVRRHCRPVRASREDVEAMSGAAQVGEGGRAHQGATGGLAQAVGRGGRPRHLPRGHAASTGRDRGREAVGFPKPPQEDAKGLGAPGKERRPLGRSPKQQEDEEKAVGLSANHWSHRAARKFLRRTETHGGLETTREPQKHGTNKLEFQWMRKDTRERQESQGKWVEWKNEDDNKILKSTTMLMPSSSPPSSPLPKIFQSPSMSESMRMREVERVCV
eukprot:Gb_15359 [translate_table: standard]